VEDNGTKRAGNEVIGGKVNQGVHEGSGLKVRSMKAYKRTLRDMDRRIRISLNYAYTITK